MSTINYTYNVIVDRFRQFAAGHFQLRRFTHGEISQADLEKEAEWPWLHVKPRAINYSPGTRAFSFEIFISDLPRDKEDKTGYQSESITDCSLIFQDLINEIYLGNMFGDQVVLTRPVNSEPFVEQYTHTLTGVTGTIELNLDYDWSACSIPASWNYNTHTDSPSDGWGALQFIESLTQDGVYVSLLNDEEAPGNSYYYGTDAEGVKGWHAIVDNIGLTCETLPECATIISILEDIAALQTDVALKANTADLGATAFSNDYNDLDNLPTIPTATSELTNDSGFITLGDVPAQVNADWNATSGVAEILNKPTIPSIAGLVPETRTLTINGTTQDLSADRTFTIDKSSVGLGNVDNTSDANKPISTATQTALNAKQDTLVSGTNIKTINGASVLGSGDLVVGGTTTLTVGTTPITSGTIGRVLFQGTGNVLQQSANLFWDNANNRLGVGTATPLSPMHLVAPSAVSTRESLFRASVSDDANSGFYINNGTIINNVFAPSFGGFCNSGFLFSLGFAGFTDAANDAADSSTNFGLVDFFATRTTTPQDPFNGTLSDVINRRLFTFRSLTNPGLLTIFSNGNVAINSTVNAGFKLDVNGSTRLNGTTSITGNPLQVNTIYPIQNANLLISAPWADSTQIAIETITNKAQVLIVRPTANLTLVSTTHDTQRITHTFAPTSGTAVVNALTLQQTINQTGGANGITRGLYVNATLTSAANFRAIETARGNIVFGNLPTSSAGLPTGALWNDAGTVKIV